MLISLCQFSLNNKLKKHWWLDKLYALGHICTHTPRGGGLPHYYYSSQVQGTNKNWTQSDLRFCDNEGGKHLKSMKGVNWISNYIQKIEKCLKSVKYYIFVKN